jgi:Tfp pilus assembly protein PilX
MKTPPPTRHRARGNVLIVTIIITAVMGLVLVSYLSMVSTQGRQTARSQTWNSARAGGSRRGRGASHLNKEGCRAA